MKWKKLKRRLLPAAIIEFDHHIVEMGVGDTFNMNFEENEEDDTVSFKILSSGIVQCRLVCMNPSTVKIITIHSRPSFRRYLSYWFHR